MSRLVSLKQLIALFIISIAFGQVNFGSTGLGSFATASAPYLLGNTAGFSFDLSSRASSTDPSSWRYLRYTIIRADYGGTVLTGDNGMLQAGSGIQRMQFIVPVKQNFAFGFGVEPYLEQSYQIRSDETSFINGADTLSQFGSNESAGGMSVAYFGFGTHIRDNMDIGFKFSGIYGSQRLKSSLTLGVDNFIQWSRNDYSGSFAQVYFTLNDVKIHDRSGWIKTALTWAFSPVSFTHTQYQLFQDVNESGINDDFHDFFDFPSPGANLDPIVSTFTDAHAPFSIELAAGLMTGKNSLIEMQASFWHENGSQAGILTLNNSPLETNLNWALTWHHFTGDYVKTLPTRLRYAGRLYGNQYRFQSMSDPVNEVGVSTRIGIKFGITDNYIDFDYSFGLRSGGNISVKSIQKFSINLSLCDIWFVKRREI